MDQNTLVETVSAVVLVLLSLIASMLVLWQYQRSGRVVAVREPAHRPPSATVSRMRRSPMPLSTEPGHQSATGDELP
jgi:hypothetical protein